MNDDITRDAGLSGDQRYRYWLIRRWNQTPAYLLWIMLNPSTADALDDDATIRKCMGFAKRMGYGCIVVVNLYALRSTDPKVLETEDDPVGPDNDDWIRRFSKHASGIMAAWGASGPKGLRERVAEVTELLPDAEVRCLGETRDGFPRHPSRPGYATPITLHFSKIPV